jgi:hypothetical protein
MLVGIVGGGFYGCSLACAIADLGIEVELIDKNDDILLEAISNNQHRLHLGYHYPRSMKTIEQCIRSYHLFLERYSYCISDIEKNYYLIEKDSKISYDNYKKVFLNSGLSFEEIQIREIEHLIKKPAKIAGVINTEEKKINLSVLTKALREKILLEKRIKVINNTKISKIAEDSTVYADSFVRKYDFVINCTYTDPKMGLYDQTIQTKNENCMLVLISMKNKKFQNSSITVMDGDYVSMYPADLDGNFTLSSVLYTPFDKSPSVNKEYDTKIIADKIINHCMEYIDIHPHEFEIVGHYLAQKTKILEDKNAFRKCFYSRSGNNISIMAGKISAILDLEHSILREVLGSV